MKLMAESTHARFAAILRILRRRGVRPGFLEMGLAADLAMAEENQDAAEIERLRATLKLGPDEVPR